MALPQKPSWLEEVGDDLRLRLEVREGVGPFEILQCDPERLVVRSGEQSLAAAVSKSLGLPSAAVSVVAADGAKARVLLIRKTPWQAVASAVWRVA